jgi:hypothetical protein
MNDTELDQLLDQWRTPVPSPALRRALSAAFPHRPRRFLFGLPIRSIAAGVTIAAALGVVGIATDFNGSIGEAGGSADLPSGRLYVRTTTLVDPPVAALHWWWKGGGNSVGQTPGGALRGSANIHDRSAHLFYGCEYVAEPLGGGLYKVTISPLLAPTVQRGPFVVTDLPAALPSLPAPQIVTDGQPVDIDVYRSATERTYIRLQVSANLFFDRKNAAPPKVQQDFLHTDRSKLYRNGILMASAEGSASGASIWFRLSGEGRYLITLDPTGNPGFVAAGQVNGDTLEFQYGSDRYRLESARPIAAGSPRPIYVFHDTAFESLLNPGHSEPMVGSAGPACFFNGSCAGR